MTIYIDSEYCCHVTDPEGIFRPVEHPFFAGKCEEFVQGYRYVPAGEQWVRPDGVIFTGEMIAPRKPYGELDSAQRSYEQALIADMRQALHTLGVTVDG